MSALALARVAVVLSALSLCVSLVGVTPADAVRAVRRALNADKVGGIGASRTPKAGKLLPLGADKRFPAAVLPAAPRGPRGPQGPDGPQGATGAQGAQGPAGLSTIRVASGAPVSLSETANASTQVARIDNLPAGKWLLGWSATLDYGAPQTIDVSCYLQIGQQQLADADTAIGTGAGAAFASVMGTYGATVQPDTFSAALRCQPTTSTSSPSHVDSQRIIAIRADSLETTGG